MSFFNHFFFFFFFFFFINLGQEEITKIRRRLSVVNDRPGDIDEGMDGLSLDGKDEGKAEVRQYRF